MIVQLLAYEELLTCHAMFRMRRIWLWSVECCVLAWLPLLAMTQDLGARSHALGHANICLSDGWSAKHNPATLALLSKAHAGTSGLHHWYFGRVYTMGVAASIPISRGGVGGGLSVFGFSDFQEVNANLSYGISLSPLVHLGICFGATRLAFGAEYGTHYTLGSTIGAIWCPNPSTRLGLVLADPMSLDVSNHSFERTRQTFKIGWSQIISDRVTSMMQADLRMNRPLNAKIALEYVPAAQLWVRLGVETLDRSLAMGFGFKLKTVLLDVSGRWGHPLGYSSSVGLTWTSVKGSKRR
jgi:hypothetical protein